MVYRIWCVVLVGIFTLSAATPVSLSGTVKDGSGAAVAGAIVSLVKGASLKDTTNAQGEFALSGSISTGVAVPYAISGETVPNVAAAGKNIQFTIDVSVARADIAIYSGSGRQVAYLALGKLEAGRQRVALPLTAPGFT